MTRWTFEDLASASRESGIENPKRCRYLALSLFGVYVALDEDETLWWAPMNSDGGPELHRGSIDWGEVTAPEPKLLEFVNEVWGTTFKMVGFAGR